MITDQQLQNLKTLRDYMDALPKDYPYFSMLSYAVNARNNYPVAPCETLLRENECGTTCCLAGHGPAAGILPISERAKRWWCVYTEEAFGCNIDLDSLGEYLFSPDWPDNTNDAIKRLDTAITYQGQVPETIIEQHKKEMGYALYYMEIDDEW